MIQGREFLAEKHPIYEAKKDEWIENERRLRGGREVLAELAKFEWETDTSDRYAARKAQATYINFPDMYLQAMVGHLFRQAPEVDSALQFGSLGSVRRKPGATQPTRAELVFYNADGAGRDGSQWNPFWARAMRWAGATGHRWIFVEASLQRPTSLLDEIRGLRPYLVHYSPLSVTNWEHSNGQLQWAIVRTSERRPRRTDKGLAGNRYDRGYLLLVRNGVTDLGDEFSAGGWWRFDSEGKPLTRTQDGQDVDLKGDWSKTGGDIPLFPIFWERDQATDYDQDDGSQPMVAAVTERAGYAREYRPAPPPLPTMSRSGIQEISQVAVSYMNQSSAADFDAWDAASSTLYAVGVDVEGMKVMAQKINEGSKVVPVPRSKDPEAGDPSITDASSGAVAAEVFDKLLQRKRDEAMELAALMATSTPDSSGRSKEAGFTDTKSPRLALIATELEQAQNTAIHFLELRFGAIESPTGSVKWPKEFDLQPLINDIEEYMNLGVLTEVRSPTLDAKMMLQAAEEKGLISDEDEDYDTIKTELQASSEQRAENAQRQTDLFNSGTGGAGDGGDQGDTGGGPPAQA